MADAAGSDHGTGSVRAIVAAHGSLAAGFISAVEQITGRGDVLLPVSNAGLSAVDIQGRLVDLLARTGARVVFTDLPAGSCTMAVRRLQRDHPDVRLVPGVNLPMLLEFVLTSAETP